MTNRKHNHHKEGSTTILGEGRVRTALVPEAPPLILPLFHSKSKSTTASTSADERGLSAFPKVTHKQGGITCGAIEDPRKSSKAIDERVIINFRDKNGVIARFRDKNVVIVRFCDKNVECLYIYYGVIEE